ncbi:hypothetical protein BDR22DRAFT_700657 [Usnea florida]
MSQGNLQSSDAPQRSPQRRLEDDRMDIDPPEHCVPSAEPIQPLSGAADMTAALTDIENEAASAKPTRNTRRQFGGPNLAHISRQRLQAKGVIEASGPAKRIRTSSAGSPTNPDPAKWTKTGPPHHVFDFRFTKPGKRRPTTFDHLFKPEAFFCTAKINSHGEDFIACLLLPYARGRKS